MYFDHDTHHHRFVLDSLGALVQMKERGSWSGWSGDHP